MPQKVLAVDDEPKIVEIARDYLERSGFDVIAAGTGPDAIEIATADKPDLVILDLLLPGMDGLDVCRELRRRSDVPIIMLTARADETDRLIGLELGADDYVTKPFSPRELVARVRAVLRRGRAVPAGPSVIRIGDLEIDIPAHSVKVRGDAVRLTPIEFNILTTLAEAPGRVFTRSNLLDSLHAISFDGFERSVDSHMKNLRKKIESDPSDPRFLLTVFGVGYKFAEDL